MTTEEIEELSRLEEVYRVKSYNQTNYDDTVLIVRNTKAAAVIDFGTRELEAQLEGHRVTGVDAVGRVAQIEDGQGRLRLSRIGAVVVLGKNAHLLLQRGVGGIHRAVAAVVVLLIAFFAAAACRFKDPPECQRKRIVVPCTLTASTSPRTAKSASCCVA